MGKVMSINVRAAIFVLGSLLCTSYGFGQQGAVTPPGPGGRISLDIVVTPRSGPPVAGLQQQDFTVLDNKGERPITSFQAAGGPGAPVEVVLLIDTVNATYSNVAYEREQIEKFLKTDGGHLAHPTTLAVLTDTGTEIQKGFSADGNLLSADLDKYTVGLRDIRRSSGFYGAEDRVDLSLKALRMLASQEATLPGRKIVLWISPGWPLLSGPRMELSFKQEQQLFGEITAISTQLRQAGVTLYSIDPLGSAEGTMRVSYYRSFLKGVTKPGQVELGDLGLQVLATQSGGLALASNNDIAAMLRECMADAQAYYTISFDASPAEHPNEYHELEIKVGKPGLIARTRTGYYAQP
jgi:VWFA-related protein